MSMKDAVISVFSKYATVAGRARRSEYWYFFLFNMIASFVLALLVTLTGISFLSGLYSLATIIPEICVSIRRLHDVGKSGWWLLLILVPVIGAIVLLVWACKDSDPGYNTYGESPKGYV